MCALCLCVLRVSSSKAYGGCSTKRKQPISSCSRSDGCSLHPSADESAASADARTDQMRFVVERVYTDEYRKCCRHIHRSPGQQVNRYETIEHRFGSVGLGHGRCSPLGQLLSANGSCFFVALSLNLKTIEGILNVVQPFYFKSAPISNPIVSIII